MMYEKLEGRRLLAVAPWSIDVNFQTPSAPSAPTGYRSDFGAAYGRRANGATYGFSSDMTGEAINRNDPHSPDERYDTFNYLRSGQTWQVKVPEPGAYRVRVVAGDPKVYNSAIRISAEHVIVAEGATTAADRWVDGTTTVSVTDGALTLESAPGAVNNKLCFVEIARVNPPPAAPAAPSATLARPVSTKTNVVTWADNAGTETGFKIERKRGSLGQFEPVAVVGANVTSFTDTPLRSGASYWYRVRAFNAAGGSAASRQDPARTFDSTGTITWEALAPSPITRAEHQAGVVNGKIYVFGGFLGSQGPVVRSDVYDPITNAWRRIADLPTRVTHAGTAADDETDSIYIAGGYVGTGPGFQQTFATDDVWRYDVATNTFSAAPSLPEARGGGAMVRMGRALHYIAGADIGRADRTEHWVLSLDHPSTGWEPLAPVPLARNHLAAEVLNGKIYVIGGQTGTNDATGNKTDVFVWDAAADTWTAAADLPRPLSHMSEATTVLNGRIYVAGGLTTGADDIANASVYDPTTDDWSAITSLPGDRFSGVLVEIEGVLYFTGGSNNAATYRGVFSG
jgi:N-acetylneuraminic acid mutarotase